MATEIDWSSIGGKRENGAKFIKFSAGKTVRVRPVGRVVTFCKFFVQTPNGNRSVCVDMENKEEAATLLCDYTGKEIIPQERFAINVIDREDGEIKILEGGKSIFGAFSHWAKKTGSDPGGQGGGDWSIAATGEGKLRRYQPNHLKHTQVSEEEKNAVIAAAKERSLVEVFRAVPLDELISKIFGEAGEPEPNQDAQSGNSESDSLIGW